MKKILFSLLMVPFMAISFVSCGDDKTPEPAAPTNYYAISVGYSTGKSAQPAPDGIMTAIKSVYTAKMDQICTTQKGSYVTTKTESEVVAALQTVEPQAQAIRELYQWDGTVNITLVHVIDGVRTNPYEKDFGIVDKTVYTLNINVEYIDSLCCALTTQQRTIFGAMLNQKKTIKVTGADSVSTVFGEAIDSLTLVLKQFTKGFSDNQSLVVKYEQKDTAEIIKKPAFIVVTRDSSIVQTTVGGVKGACQATYHFSLNSTDRADLWLGYYRPYLEANCEKYSAMHYQLKKFTPNVAESDSTFKAMLVSLEPGAYTYLSDKQWKQQTLKVDRESIFGNKADIYTKTFTPDK